MRFALVFSIFLFLASLSGCVDSPEELYFPLPEEGFRWSYPTNFQTGDIYHVGSGTFIDAQGQPFPARYVRAWGFQTLVTSHDFRWVHAMTTGCIIDPCDDDIPKEANYNGWMWLPSPEPWMYGGSLLWGQRIGTDVSRLSQIEPGVPPSDTDVIIDGGQVTVDVLSGWGRPATTGAGIAVFKAGQSAPVHLAGGDIKSQDRITPSDLPDVALSFEPVEVHPRTTWFPPEDSADYVPFPLAEAYAQLPPELTSDAIAVYGSIGVIGDWLYSDEALVNSLEEYRHYITLIYPDESTKTTLVRKVNADEQREPGWYRLHDWEAPQGYDDFLQMVAETPQPRLASLDDALAFTSQFTTREPKNVGVDYSHPSEDAQWAYGYQYKVGLGDKIWISIDPQHGTLAQIIGPEEFRNEIGLP